MQEATAIVVHFFAGSGTLLVYVNPRVCALIVWLENWRAAIFAEYADSGIAVVNAVW